MNPADLQSAKFPPHFQYLFASCITFTMAIYFRNKSIKNSRILSHIGQNALWYYFGQGIGSSIIFYIVFTLQLDNWFLKWVVIFVINLIISTICAEVLARSYNLLGAAIERLKNMNVYDFDKTIYSGDSTIDFYLYELKKKPSLLFFLPSQVMAALKYKFKIISKTKFKEVFFSFLKRIDDIDSEVERFWDCHQYRINKWYLVQKEAEDVIISASPEFLLKEIVRRLEVKNIIASKVDKKTGEFRSKNCYGAEKVIRFKEVYNEKINKFYTDSKSDKPLAIIAEEAFLVKRKDIQKWNI